MPPTTKLVAVFAVLATSCGGRPAPAVVEQRNDETSIAARTSRVPPSDTAFIEISRFERHGIRNARGHCQWSYANDPPMSVSRGGRREVRVVALDRTTCTQVAAVGYRRVYPPDDTTGFEAESAFSVWPARDGDTAKKPRRP
jgi:hypothetical protein